MAVDEDDELPDWWEPLDAGERQRAGRFRQAADRRLFLAAHWLTRRLLADYTGEPAAEIRILSATDGKPRLAGHPTVSFSLTHTRGLVACGVAEEAEIGIDAEILDCQIQFDAVARSFFAPAEAEAIERAEGETRIELFYRLWTLKEAVVKADGRGQSIDAIAFDLTPPVPRLLASGGAIWSLAELQPTPDHRLAVALRHRHRQR
ncbi:MAG TPA: 4'-phosphopantetheinyl transferase superfamily protein [Rhodospirillaceae bacterium]|nr:4'-phosphopantetheinyl transferase superfamily protein [Rhodospirillaceae bacterium]